MCVFTVKCRRNRQKWKKERKNVEKTQTDKKIVWFCVCEFERLKVRCTAAG